MIYFIANAGQIKVGYASNVDARLRTFRTTIPAFTLLGTMEGGRGHERTIHDALEDFRCGGEWFSDCPEVRKYLLEAMKSGVTEWIPERTRSFTPSMWDNRAARLAEIICADRPKSEFAAIESELDIPRGALWNLRYRQSREVSVGEYFSLIAAARNVIWRRQRELSDDLAFVSDLEREDAEASNSTFDLDRAVYVAERQLRAAKALVGEED